MYRKWTGKVMEWLDRFVMVMDIISAASMEGVGTSDLARQTLLSKGTLHRILQGMVERELVTQNQHTRKYRLGPKAMIWGSNFLAGHDPVELLREYCDLLAQRTGVYTYLSKFDSGQVYCIYTKQPSDIRNTYFVRVGQIMPLYCTAAAKAIFAFQPQFPIDSLLLREQHEKFTEYTKTDVGDIKAELAEIQKNRIAFCVEELEPGVSAMATPIFHSKGEASASIGLIASTQYIENNREFLIRELAEIGEKASRRISSAYLLASTK